MGISYKRLKKFVIDISSYNILAILFSRFIFKDERYFFYFCVSLVIYGIYPIWSYYFDKMVEKQEKKTLRFWLK